jgi:hypothetical protein
MRGGGANYNTLYADDSDDDSDGFGCVFPKDNGFDTDSDGSDFSNLADDLFEKASVDSFEFVPPNTNERANGSGYNRAKLDIDNDAVSVGSDTEFQRASKSNKRWDWVEADEESVGSDSDFEVQFEGRSNSVYDLKAGQGEIEDFLGGGGGEDLNEDFEFRTDFADAQRAEAFFNEGQKSDRGGVLVDTEYIPAKAGAAQRRRVDPKFIAAHGNKRTDDPDALIPAPKSSGKSKSAALIAAGLAQAQAKKGGKSRYSAKIDTAVGEATEAEVLPITRRGPRGEVEGGPAVEALDEILDLEDEALADALKAAQLESDAQAKVRIDRSLEKLKAAFKKTTDEAGREKIEEHLLSELDDISADVQKGLKALQRRGKETNTSRVQAVLDAVLTLQARMDAGLTPAGMIQAARKLMMLEHEYNKLEKELEAKTKAKAATATAKEEKARAKASKAAREAKADEGDDEGEAPRPSPPVPRRSGEPALEEEGKVVGDVEIRRVIPVRKPKAGAEPKRPMYRIGFAGSQAKISTELGLDKLETLLSGVKAEAGAKVDPDAKKEIIRQLKRFISEKKLAMGLREKRAPSGFLKARADGTEPPRPRETKNLSGLTQAQRSQRAK